MNNFFRYVKVAEMGSVSVIGSYRYAIFTPNIITQEQKFLNYFAIISATSNTVGTIIWCLMHGEMFICSKTNTEINRRLFCFYIIQKNYIMRYAKSYQMNYEIPFRFSRLDIRLAIQQ